MPKLPPPSPRLATPTAAAGGSGDVGNQGIVAVPTSKQLLD